jgi:hypothetical protein
MLRIYEKTLGCALTVLCLLATLAVATGDDLCER